MATKKKTEEAPAPTASGIAALMRQQLNQEAKSHYDSLKPEAKKKYGEYRDVAMDPSTAEELMSIKEFISMKAYFMTCLGIPGFPCGAISQICGKSDSGKTTMLIEAMVACQKAGGIVFFIDSENKFPWDRFEEMGGVAADVVAIPVNSLEGAWNEWWRVLGLIDRIRTDGIFEVETGKDEKGKAIIVEVPVDKDIKILAAWDSVAASVADRILEEDDAGDAHVAVEARINNKNVRKLKKKLKTSRVAAVFINHAYMTMPMMGAPEKVVKGGEEMFYMSSLIIEMVKGGIIDREVTVDGQKFKQKIGREVRMDVLKGHMSGRYTLMQLNACAPGLLNKDELAEYRKSIQGQL